MSNVDRSYLRGHPIYFDGQVWRYVDTDEPTASTWQNRPCGRCNRFPTADGHDACLGTLPGVMNACCGHGQQKDAYVQSSTSPLGPLPPELEES